MLIPFAPVIVLFLVDRAEINKQFLLTWGKVVLIGAVVVLPILMLSIKHKNEVSLSLFERTLSGELAIINVAGGLDGGDYVVTFGEKLGAFLDRPFTASKTITVNHAVAKQIQSLFNGNDRLSGLAGNSL